MRVYLAEYEIYKDDYGDLCNPQNGSAVFLDLDDAYKHTLDEINGFISDREENRTEREDYEFEYGGYFRITEKDTEDDSVNIEYRYHLFGNLASRFVQRGDYMYLDMPETKGDFKEGDIVRMKDRTDPDESELFVVRSMDRRGNGSVVSLDNKGYYVNLVRVNKQHLLPYTGEVPENINVLSKIFKGETNISLKRLKEFYGENFINDITPPGCIPHELDDITDDSTDTAPFLVYLIRTRQLALPNAPVYRLLNKGDINS